MGELEARVGESPRGAASRSIRFSLPNRRSRVPRLAREEIVLLVSDDAPSRKLAARMLNALASPLRARRARSPRRWPQRGVKPDAALVDVWLPDGTASPWPASFRPCRGPRVILTSSDPDAASQSDVHRSGADAFVPKAQLPNSGSVTFRARVSYCWAVSRRCVW